MANSPVPQDLIDYLINMISPPFPHPRAVFWDGLEDNLLRRERFEGPSAHDANSLTGIVLRPKIKGQPTPDQSQELLRILRPGAMLLVIAPEDQPTGHTGAVNIEDAGFEIRDSICWANLAGDGEYLHYVPKTARSEREAGCYDLPAKTGAEAVDREEGTAGMDNPRAGAGRTANEVHNFHPTLKPVNLMERLLQDVPLGQGPVIDPFLGSGTTAIACIKTGHDFIGIEREDDFIAIATTRARHWKDKELRGDRWEDVEIVSDYVPPAKGTKPESTKPKSAIEDLFG